MPEAEAAGVVDGGEARGVGTERHAEHRVLLGAAPVAPLRHRLQALDEPQATATRLRTQIQFCVASFNHQATRFASTGTTGASILCFK